MQVSQPATSASSSRRVRNMAIIWQRPSPTLAWLPHRFLGLVSGGTLAVRLFCISFNADVGQLPPWRSHRFTVHQSCVGPKKWEQPWRLPSWVATFSQGRLVTSQAGRPLSSPSSARHRLRPTGSSRSRFDLSRGCSATMRHSLRMSLKQSNRHRA